MAVDGISSALAGAASDPYGQQNADNISNISQTASGFLQGINESKSIAQKQLNYVSDIAVDVGDRGWFAEMLGKLVGNSDEQQVKDEEARSLSESIKDALDDMRLLDETTEKDRSEGKKKRGKVAPSTKMDDLKSLPFEFATLGAVLANAISAGPKKDKKEGKSISGFFKGLLEGVSGIAALGVALVAFAGAAVIFNFVDWGKAVVGLLAFTVFTLGMVAIAKLMGKSTQKQLKEFAASSLLMSAALGVFAVSISIAAGLFTQGVHQEIGPLKINLNPISWKSALTALGYFGVFIVGMIVVSHLIKGGDFNGFAKSSLLMATSIAVFAVSLSVAANVFTNGVTILGKKILDPISWNDAWKTLGLFGAFITSVTILASIVAKNNGDMTKFAKGSLLMAASIAAFALAISVAANVFTNGVDIMGKHLLDPVSWNDAWKTLGLFEVFIVSVTVLAAIVAKANGDMTKFALGSMLMTVALGTFALSISLVGNIISGNGFTIPGTELTIPGTDIISAIEGVALFAGFMLAVVGLSALASGAMANIAIFSGVSVLMSVALAAFGVALSVAGVAVFGGEVTINGKLWKVQAGNGLKALAAIPEMVAFMAAFAGLGAMFLVPFAGQAMLAGIAAASVAITAIAIATTLFAKAMMMAGGVITGGDFEIEGKHYKMEPYNAEAVSGMFDVMTSFIEAFAKIADKIGVKGAIAVAVLGKSVTPLIDAMLKMVDVVDRAAKSKDNIDAIINGTPVYDQQGNMVSGPNAIEHLMDPVLMMLLGKDGNGGLMKVADQLGVKGAIALRLVTSSVVPLIESMDKMIGVVLHAAELDMSIVPVAMNNLQTIMFGPGIMNDEDGTLGTGFLSMFTRTANSLKGTSVKALLATKSLPPVVETLDGLIGVISKSGELDPAKIQAGVFGLSAASNFLIKFIETINDIIPGGFGGAITKFFGGDPIKKVEEAHEYLQEGGAFYNIFEDMSRIAQNFDGKGFENLGKVTVIGSFTTDMLTASVNFKDIMGNVQSGIEKFKSPQMVDQIANALDKVAAVGDIAGKFDPLYQLAEQSAKIHTVATDVEKIAKAYEKIAAAEKIGSIGKSIQKSAMSIPATSTNSNNSSQAAVNNNDKEVGGLPIEYILNDWYVNGVKIKQAKQVEAAGKPVNLMSL